MFIWGRLVFGLWASGCGLFGFVRLVVRVGLCAFVFLALGCLYIFVVFFSHGSPTMGDPWGMHLRYIGDTFEIHGRSIVDPLEIHGRYMGDIFEIYGRYM